METRVMMGNITQRDERSFRLKFDAGHEEFSS